MAIKIRQGIQYKGRITMPKGTFLPELPKFDNPSTAAAGTLSNGIGTNVPQIQLGGQPNTPAPYNPLDPAKNAFQQVFNTLKNINQQMITAYNAAELTPEEVGQKFGPVAENYVRIFSGLKEPQTTPTTAFRPPTSATQSSFVGADITSAPEMMDMNSVRALIPGGVNLSPEQITAFMATKGYQYVYQNGGYFFKQNLATPQTGTGAGGGGATGELDARGRPQWVDPTQLERGQRVTAADGTTYVGGEPYTNPAGDTVSQYAITFAGGEEVTRYKEVVKQDSQGNWVKMYIPKTGGKGAGYSRNRRTRARAAEARYEREAAAQAAAQAAVSPTVQPEVSTQQLVNLRASYG